MLQSRVFVVLELISSVVMAAPVPSTGGSRAKFRDAMYNVAPPDYEQGPQIFRGKFNGKLL